LNGANLSIDSAYNICVVFYMKISNFLQLFYQYNIICVPTGKASQYVDMYYSICQILRKMANAGSIIIFLPTILHAGLDFQFFLTQYCRAFLLMLKPMCLIINQINTTSLKIWLSIEQNLKVCHRITLVVFWFFVANFCKISTLKLKKENSITTSLSFDEQISKFWERQKMWRKFCYLSTH
jgi:hypothetical protein